MIIWVAFYTHALLGFALWKYMDHYMCVRCVTVAHKNVGKALKNIYMSERVGSMYCTNYTVHPFGGAMRNKAQLSRA